LHYGFNIKSTGENIDNPYFEAEFKSILEAKDGNWCGFVFPSSVKLPKQITFAIDAQGCCFEFLDLSGVVFKEPVDFSDSIFKGNLTLRNCIFEEISNFNSCQFQGSVEVFHVRYKKLALFYRAEFMDRTIFKANFVEQANFNEVVFRDVVVFAGWRETTGRLHIPIENIVTASGDIAGKKYATITQKIQNQLLHTWSFLYDIGKRFQKESLDAVKQADTKFKIFRRSIAKVDPDTNFFRVFEGGGFFQGVIILKPDQTLFSKVDMSRVHFRGTNLRGIRFIGVNWWQPALKRNGLYDEVFIRNLMDGPLRHSSLPALEEACRNARVALEENKSFNIASDFYIGEMEAVRQQQPKLLNSYFFSVAALYRIVSQYGTNVAHAVLVLSLIFLIHVKASIYYQLPGDQILQLDCFLRIVLRSLKILLLQGVSDSEVICSSNKQEWLDLSLRLFGPIQMAMVAIAFRARIKRH